MLSALVVSYLVTCLAFIGIWLIHVMTKDAGVIDYYWGPGFLVIGLVEYWFNGADSTLEWIFLAAIGFWGFRLAAHLVHRHHGSEHEDGRYKVMRENGGPNFWWKSLFTIFLLQATILWLIAMPVHVAIGAQAAANTPLFAFGMVIFVIGLALEWIADAQLAYGKSANVHSNGAAGIYQGGLWGVSRHPNYLGEMALWFGLAIAAFALSGNWMAFVGPALLAAVIMGISLPLTDAHMRRTRQDFDDYAQKVPALLPMWRGAPKSVRSDQQQS